MSEGGGRKGGREMCVCALSFSAPCTPSPSLLPPRVHTAITQKAREAQLQRQRDKPRLTEMETND